MAAMEDLDGFGDFVAKQSRPLLRSAWLLTGNWSSAEDLVQVALAATWRRWDHIERTDAPQVYARRVLMTTFLRWHGEIPTRQVPDGAEPDRYAAADLRQSLLAALSALSEKQRAVVVLRYLEDLPEAAVAEILGCSVGTVKKQAHRALEHLRLAPDLADLMSGGMP